MVNQKPIEISRTVAKLPVKQVIAEGLRYNPVDFCFFVSSIYKGIINNVNKRNKILWQCKNNNFGSIAGLKIDRKKNLLWGTFEHQPQSQNFLDSLNGSSGIFCYNFLTKELLLKIEVDKDSPEHHWFGDISLDSNRNVYATDSYTDKIYKFSAPDFKPQIFLSDYNFFSLQGLTFTNDDKFIIFADFPSRLYLYNNKTKEVNEIENLTNHTLPGIDGIYFYKNNKIIAVQNGIYPRRIVEITLDNDYTEAIK
jgi:hypothetical protein